MFTWLRFASSLP